MPQNEHIELFRKRHGRRLDHGELQRKKAARASLVESRKCQTATRIEAKLLHKRKHAEKVQLKKKLRAHQLKVSGQGKVKGGDESEHVAENAIPAYLLDRAQAARSKVLKNVLKEKKKEKTMKYDVPVSAVKQMTEDEMFKILRSGKNRKKTWKRRINNICYVPEDFTRKNPKFEKYIRPTGLRMKEANVTHPDLKSTFKLPIIGVKRNPQSALYTSLGVITKGAILEVNVSQLGLLTTSGKIVWAKNAQVMNNPEIDGCINATLLV